MSNEWNKLLSFGKIASIMSKCIDSIYGQENNEDNYIIDDVSIIDDIIDIRVAIPDYFLIITFEPYEDSGVCELNIQVDNQNDSCDRTILKKEFPLEVINDDHVVLYSKFLPVFKRILVNPLKNQI